MSDRRPFPPSPRRLALARRAGLTGVSPLLVAAVACVGAIVAAVMLARAAAVMVGGWIAAACNASDGALPFGALGSGALPSGALPSDGGAVASDHMVAGALAPARVAGAVLELAAPVVVVAALAAFVVHVAQTRGVWLPRRRISGAPVLEAHPLRRSALEMCNAAVIGTVALGWLWLTAPRLARLVELDAASTLAGVGAAIASLIVSFAIAWIALGVIDALVRRAELTAALAMTAPEKREDDRLAAADPRWRAQRLSIMRGPAVSDAVASAAVVLLGDDLAVAISWHPTRQPVPLRAAVGRRARATQLIGLARRYRIAVHRDAELTAALAGAEGPVPETYWAKLADIVAAVRRES